MDTPDGDQNTTISTPDGDEHGAVETKPFRTVANPDRVRL